MRYEQQREHRTGTSRSHKSCQSGRRREFGELNPSPLLVKIYFRLSRFQSLLLLIHFRYDPNTCSHYTKVWHRTSPICGVPLSRLTWRGELKSQSLLQNIYFRLSRFESSLLLYTSATVRIHIHIAPTLHFRDWRGAASLLYKNRAEISLCTDPPPLLRFLLRGGGGSVHRLAEITVLMCEPLSAMVSVPA